MIDLPIPLRLAGLFLLGAGLGAAVNAVACRFGEQIRRVSPWLAPDKKAPPRKWHDRIPIVGWIGLRREARLHGPGFWIRPLFVELAVAFALSALYYWEVVARGLIPAYCEAPSAAILHLQFAAHAVLLVLLLAGSLIDLDDRIIPDVITVPGTLIGLAFALIAPGSMLPIADRAAMGETARVSVTWLTLAAPNPWPASLAGAPQLGSLGIALACWWGWCLALMPHTWYARRGIARALRLSFARRVHRSTWWLWAIGVLGSGVCVLAWRFGGENWRGLLTSLVGLAGGGAMIWAVRLIGRHTLMKEAMGFGDVTLMAMIGAFLGWQTSLLVFFFAPLAGVVLGVIQWLLRADSAMPYGPFLALATAFIVARWVAMWEWTWAAFSFGWLVPAGFAVCMALMAIMLTAWRLISDKLLPPERED